MPKKKDSFLETMMGSKDVKRKRRLLTPDTKNGPSGPSGTSGPSGPDISPKRRRNGPGNDDLMRRLYG